MKNPFIRAGLALLASASFSHGQTFVPLVFDNQAGFDNSQVFVHFLAGDASGIAGHYFDLSGTQQILEVSTPYVLAELAGPSGHSSIPANSPAAFLNEFSGRVYFSLGTSGLVLPNTGYSPSAADPTDPNFLARYQYVEPTIKGGVFEGDLSYIDFTSISFSLRAENFQSASNNPQISQNAYLLVNAAKATAAPGKSAVLPDTVTNLNNPVADPDFTRVIGPNIDGTPFNGFEDYINAMNGKTVKLGGLFVGTGTQDGSTLPENRIQTYDYVASFSGTVADGGSVTITASSGSGNGNASWIPPAIQGQGVGDQVTITISYQELNAIKGIYGNSPAYQINNTAFGNITTTGLTNDVYGRVVGDLLAGFSLGYLDSPVTLTPGGPQVGQMYSSEWWGAGIGSADQQYLPDGTKINNATTPAAKGIFFRTAQPDVADPTKPRYHQYADALVGGDPSHPLTPGYGFPLQDRLGGNLLTLDLTQAGNSGAFLRVIINPDLGQALNTAIWDGGAGNGLWSSAANWNPNSVPSSGAIIQFAGSNQTSVTVGDTRTVGGLFFNFGASAFIVGSAPNENKFLLAGNIANSSSNVQTINSGIDFTSPTSIVTAVSGDLVLVGDLALGSTAVTITGNASRNVTLSGVISGAGSLTKTGLSSLALNGNNTFTGGFTLNGGVARLGSSTALGTGTVTLGAGELQSTGGPLTITNAITLTGSTTSTIGFAGSVPFTFNGPVTLTGSSQIRNVVDLAWNGLLGATGPDANTFVLTKTGAGKMTLGGASANTFAGTVQVNNGILELAKTTGPALLGSLVIGDGTTQTTNAIARLAASGQFPTTQPLAQVTVNSNGEFDTQTFAASLNQLSLSGGNVTGIGTLTFASSPALPIVLFSGTGNAASTISANLSLTDATSFNVFASDAAVELTVSGSVSGAGGLSKNNGGTLALTGDNSGLSGDVTIGGGVLATTSLANASVVLSGGTLSPGGLRNITNIMVNNLTLNSGGFLHDLGATTSDRVTVTTEILGTNPTATFFFQDDGFLTTPADTPVTFTILSTSTASEITKILLPNLSFSSVNIAGLTGTFSLDPINGHLLFEARHGVTGAWSTTAANGLWGAGANWVGGVVPSAGADLSFTTSTSTALTLQADRQTGNITFDAGGDAFTFNGNNLILGGNFINNANATQTLNSGVILNGNRSILSNDGSILVQGDIALSQSTLPGTLTLGGAGAVTVNGVISNAIGSITDPQPGNLMISGPGTTTLTAANTFTGSVTLQGGTLAISSDGNLGSSGLSSVFPANNLIFNGGTLQFGAPVVLGLARTVQFSSQGIIDTNGHAVTLQGTMSGPAGFRKLGAGALTLASSTSQSTFGGTVQVEAGTLIFSVAGSLGASTAIIVDNGAALQIGSNVSLTNQTLSLNGTGVASSGALNIAQGNVTISSPTTLTGDSSIVAQNLTSLVLGAINLNSHTLTLAPANASVTLTLGGPISGTGGLTISSPSTGSVGLLGANTYSGPTIVNTGTLTLNNTTNLQAATGAITVLSGGTLQLSNQPINTADTGIQLSNALTLNGNGAGSNGALSNSRGLNVLTGAVTLADNTLIKINDGSLTLSGSMTGPGGLTLQSGAAQLLTLSGTNSFAGDVAVQTGTLVASGTNSLGLGTTTVSNGASLRLSGGVSINSSTGLTLNGPGAGGTSGALQSVSGNNTYTGPVTIGPGSTLNVSGGSLTFSNTTALQANALAVTTAQGSSMIFNGALTSTTSAANLQIIGPGSVTLGAASPGFTGNVNVQNGSTLITGNATPLDNGTLILSAGGTLSPGGAGTLQTLSLSTVGQIDGILYFDLGPANTSDQIALTTGAPSFGSTASFFFNDAGYAGPGVYTLFTSPGAPVGFAGLTFSTNIQGLTGTFSAPSTDLLFTASGGGSTAATWDGGAGNGLWASADNWDPNGLPDLGAALTFAGAVQTTIDTGIGRVTGNITFNNTADSFTLNNNTLSVNGNITNDSTNAQTLNSTVIINNDRTFSATSGALNFGAIQINPATTTPHTLTFAGANNITVNGAISNQGSAPGNILKTGGGLLTLGGPNTYSGTTTISAGTLAASSLGDGSATNTLILNGGTFSATGNLTSPAARGVQISGVGSTIQTNANTVTLNGVVSGTGDWAKLGTGSLVLASANTFSGAVAVTEGTLNLRNNAALGGSAGGVTVSAGATLELQNNITIGAEPLSLAGTGVGGNGALRNVSGNNTYGGPITLANNTTIQVGAGTTLTLGGGLDLNGHDLLSTSPGLLRSNGITGNGNLTLNSTGTVEFLNGTHDFTGTATIAGSTLRAGDLSNATILLNAGAFGPGQSGALRTVTLNGLTLGGGDLLFDLGNSNASDRINIVGGTASLAAHTVFNFNSVAYQPGTFTLLSGTGVAAFDLNDLSFTHTIPGLSGSFSIVGSDLQFTTTLATTVTWDGGGGTGNWSNANNWNPDLVPTPGDALIFTGSVQTTVDTQANRTTGTLTFDANASAFTLNNNTITATGAITNQSANLQTINSGLTFNHNGVINAAVGDFLINGNIAISNNTTTRTLTLTGSGATTFNGIISNGPAATSGNLLKTGTGTLTLTGSNTYSGTTTLSNGILEISNTNNLGNGSPTNNLIFNGGTLRFTADVAALAQNVSLQSTGTVDTGTHNVGIGTTISGPGGFTKLGTGQLTLSGANTYTGLTRVAAGSVTLTNNNALGTTADGTLVESGASLLLNNVAIGNETLLLNGGGVTGTNGALVSTGTNSWGGSMLLGSDSILAVSGTSFTASGSVLLGTSTLTVNNVAPTTLTGIISGSGGLTKLGSADLLLTGNNTFTGTTTISGGTLQIGNGSTSGSLSGPIINNALFTVNRSDTLLLPGVISGTGQLNQNGIGTLILSGNNTFTGTTNINAGTLQLGNGGTSGSLHGPIINNSTLRFNRSDVFTQVGTISGTGNLIQAGSGTLILSSTHTYGGGTLVTNGTLRLTQADAIGSGNLTVQNNAILQLTNGITLPVGQTLSLTGTLQSDGGANTWLSNITLAGNSTFSNTTAGTTFTIGSGSFTEFINTQPAGFTLTFDGPGDIFLNSTITGSDNLITTGPANVIKNGSGTLTFFADENAYTGSTTVNDGTLILDTITDLNGAIKGTLVTIGDGLGAPQSAIVQLGPIIAPLANEMINNTAQVRLFFDGLFNLNTQTETIGSLQFTGGTITTGTGGSLRFDPLTPAGGITTNAAPGQLALIDATGGTLHLNGQRTLTIAAGGNAADLEIRGPIVDGTVSSGLTQQGNGILLLSGISTYTGPTNILGGTLRLEGNLGNTAVTIANGATLGGSGTLGGTLIVQSGGLLSPGSSPGILTVGALTLLPGSTTLFEIEGLTPGTQHDQIQVLGHAALAGTAQILFNNFTPSDGDTFTLIQAGSLTGTYDNVTSNLGAIFALDTTYSPTTFQLAIRVTQLDYTTFALTPNQFNVAANLDTFSRLGSMPELITLLNGLDAANLSNALQQISPDGLGSMAVMARQYNRSQGRNLFHRLSEWRLTDGGIAGTVSTASLRLLDWTSQPVIAGTKLREYTPVSLDSITAPGWSLFASGTGQFGDIESDGNGSGFDFTTGGMTFGIDRKITRIADGDVIGGFYAGYAGSDAKLDGAGGRIETDGGKFGVFGSWVKEGLYVNAQVGGGISNYDTRRNVLGQRQIGSTTGYEFMSEGAIGHEWTRGPWTFGPEAALSYSYIGIDRFTERGGIAPLQIQDQDLHSLQTRLGWRTSYEWTGRNQWWLRPAVHASWGHEFLDTATAIESRFASGAGGIFSVMPTQTGRDTAIAGASLTFGQGTNWNGWIAYEAEVGSNLSVHTLNAGAAFKF